MSKAITYEDACSIMDEDIARRYFSRQNERQQKTSHKTHHWHVVNRLRFTVFLVVVILTVVMTGGIVFGAFDAEGSSKTTYEMITIQYGDTLWEIAECYKPEDKDVRDFMYEICDYNKISAGEIYQGQNIMIPISQ